jgi:hypothetical protein
MDNGQSIIDEFQLEEEDIMDGKISRLASTDTFLLREWKERLAGFLVENGRSVLLRSLGK